MKDAASKDAAFAWLDPKSGLILGDAFGKARFLVDIGHERLAPIGPMPDARAETVNTPLADPASPAIWSDTPSGRKTGHFILTLEGRRYAATSQKHLLIVGLQEIERVRPGTLEKLSHDKARTKRVVSKDRSALNEDPKLAEKFSQRIEGGWWAFTNNSFPETKKFILRAAFHAGLVADVERLA